MARLNVLGLVPFPTGCAPAQRYRIEQWAPILRQDAIDITFSPFLDIAAYGVLYRPGRFVEKSYRIARLLPAYVRRFRLPRKFDAVHVTREASLLGGPWLEEFAARRRPLIYDFDDAIWIESAPGSSNPKWRWLRNTGKIARLCALATHIVVGNEYLAAFARRWNPKVSIVPSTIDLASYTPPRVHAASEIPTIGWMGSHSTSIYLEAVFPALEELARRRRFRFLVIGADVRARPGLRMEVREWSAAREVEDLREMDVGIMPMPDDEWSRGKCAMKALQYLGVGVPAVASPFGMTPQVVIPNQTGLLAQTLQEWVSALDRLLADPELRSRFGANGRSLVHDSFSAAVQAKRMAEIFRGL